jgi:hypothetical protein
MATTNKNFKIKQGLVVEGTTGTINGFNILTESQDSQDFIIDIIGGETLITSVESTQLEVISGELNVKSGVFDAYGAADEAYSNATSYADGLASNYDAAGSASNAQAAAEDYADGLASNYDAAGSAANAQAAAEDYADGLAVNYDAAGSAANAYANATSYTDSAVAGLVDSAPELLNTLNELAAAIGDDANFASSLTSLVGTKQDALTAGSNIDITGNTISVTGLDSEDISDFNTAALSATASAYDATGTAQGIVDALDTDDIEEGTTNQYFTDSRAKDSAADLLTGASLTNITITGSGAGLTITAENGVADSTTDDLEEGSTNLYFSNALAVSALEAVVPNFTAVELNSVAKQVAATLSAPTAGIQVGHSFAKADYRSAEYLVKVAYGDHSEISKVLLTLDVNDNISITEYGIVGTNGSAATISADISGTDVRLLVTTANNNSTVTVMGTLLV